MTIKYQITGPEKIAMALRYHLNIEFKTDRSGNIMLYLTINTDNITVNYNIIVYYGNTIINEAVCLPSQINIVRDILDHPEFAILHLQHKFHEDDHKVWSFKTFLVKLIKLVTVGTIEKV